MARLLRPAAPRPVVFDLVVDDQDHTAESLRRGAVQAAVTTSGDANITKIHEQVRFLYDTKGFTPEQLNNVGIYFMQTVTAPPRLAGTITLVHETMDQVKEARSACWWSWGWRKCIFLVRGAGSLGPLQDQPFLPWRQW